MRRLRPRASILLAGCIAFLGVAFLGGCGKGQNPPKVLVIGMDGATWDLMGPFMDQGHLPRLKALRDGGVYGPLLSVIPPLSPPAWTSAATGVNPGMHGIFDFFRLDPDSMIVYSETARSRRVPGVWTLLSEAGHKVGMLNMPMTDPPDPVDGFMVAGLPHPDSVGFAYPPELEARLHREGYRLDRMGEALIAGHEADLESEIVGTFRKRKQVALELGEENPDLDMYWVVFTGTDRIQHFFWKFMEKDHPFYDPALAPRFGDSILHVYEAIDEAVGELVDQASAQAAAQGRELAVIVLSDHGFCGVHRAFRPESFLAHPPDGEKPITRRLRPRDQRHHALRAGDRAGVQRDPDPGAARRGGGRGASPDPRRPRPPERALPGDLRRSQGERLHRTLHRQGPRPGVPGPARLLPHQ